MKTVAVPPACVTICSALGQALVEFTHVAETSYVPVKFGVKLYVADRPAYAVLLQVLPMFGVVPAAVLLPVLSAHVPSEE
jgi:hypothetical protein